MFFRLYSTSTMTSMSGALFWCLEYKFRSLMSSLIDQVVQAFYGGTGESVSWIRRCRSERKDCR